MEKDFFSTHSLYTDPKHFSSLFQKLPKDIDSMCDICHNLIIHRDTTKKLYDFSSSKNRQLEPDTRFISKMLEKLELTSLQEIKKPEDRFVGTCRDFALLLCSMLRSQSIPARVRCGFASYFHPGEFVDHWVCEYWNEVEKQWILVDAEIGKEERSFYHLESFPNTNIPRDQFMVSGNAWKQCRKGFIDPTVCGVPKAGITGWWFLKANLFRDLAAVNKVELLPWDYTEYTDDPFTSLADISEDEVRFLDHLAELLIDVDSHWDEIQKLIHADERCKLPTEVKSYTIEGMKKLILADI